MQALMQQATGFLHCHNRDWPRDLQVVGEAIVPSLIRMMLRSCLREYYDQISGSFSALARPGLTGQALQRLVRREAAPRDPALRDLVLRDLALPERDLRDLALPGHLLRCFLRR